MNFKLVRVDSSDVSKIQLTNGTHLLGRGNFLDCHDKRVSRNHGELEVASDTITIKALHQNPCFYTKKSDTDKQILKQNSQVNLGNGDRFGLLPDSYWYEVLYCIADVDEIGPTQKIVENEKNENEEGSSDATVVNNKQIEVTEGQNNSQNTIDNEENGKEPEVEAEANANNMDDSQMLNFDMNDTLENVEQPASPSLLPPEESHTEKPQSLTEEYPLQTPPAASDQASVKSPKRSHSPSPEDGSDDVKKVKTEPVDVKQEPGNAAAGPSNDQGASSNADGNAKQIPPSPVKPPNPPNPQLRERCMYGDNCYRRNPQHKAQFSHPSDADWGAGDRGVCPWGAGCRRADPRHWRDHEHPPGVNPPPPNIRPAAGKRKKKQRVRDDDDEDDSPVQGLIVTGKRARRTIKRQSWSGSESGEEEDPYGTDESDEWQPPSDVTQSQDYTQDTEE